MDRQDRRMDGQMNEKMHTHLDFGKTLSTYIISFKKNEKK